MIIIPGQPQGKARARTVTRGGVVRSYTPPKTADYEKMVAFCYRTQGGRYYSDDPVRLHIAAFYEIPKSWSRKKRDEAAASDLLPTVKPDCDNCIKIIADALNGVAYADDKQIISVNLTKRYSREPRVEVHILPMGRGG